MYEKRIKAAGVLTCRFKWQTWQENVGEEREVEFPIITVVDPWATYFTAKCFSSGARWLEVEGRWV